MNKLYYLIGNFHLASSLSHPFCECKHPHGDPQINLITQTEQSQATNYNQSNQLVSVLVAGWASPLRDPKFNLITDRMTSSQELQLAKNPLGFLLIAG